MLQADRNTDVKYKLGWVTVPGYGSLPVPPEMWTEEYKDLNLPFTFWNNCEWTYGRMIEAELIGCSGLLLASILERRRGLVLVRPGKALK